MKQLVLGILLTAISCFSQQTAPVTDAAKQTKIESATDGITRDQANAILLELKAIHQLLEKQTAATGQAQPQPPQKVSMKVEPGWQVLGRDDAPVTIVEFGDYQCPYCRKFHGTTYADLKKNYIDTGKVRYIVRDFPLPFHANAGPAALAVRCAAEQGQVQFLALRDLMLENSSDLSAESITKYGNQINLDMPKFRDCIDTKRYYPAVQKDIADANALGINATPSFVIGKTAKDQIDGVRIAGAPSYPGFESAIQAQIPHPSVAAGNR